MKELLLMRQGLWLVRLTLVAAFFLTAAVAQDAPGLRKGNAELGFFGGGSLGLDTWRATGGVNYSHAVTNDILVYGEYNYLPGFNRNFLWQVKFPSRTINVNVPFRQVIHDINGGIHVRLPIPESSFVPYVAVGVGVLHYPAVTARGAYSFDNLTPAFSEVYPSDSTVAVNFGGGVRYYLHRNFALRAEIKAYKGLNETSYRDVTKYGLFMRSVVGIVFQFK
jgi:hypothetical protein